MDYVVAFDIGTTAVKGVIVSSSGELIMEKSLNLETVFLDDYKEQRPIDWYSAFCRISKDFFQRGISPNKIIGVVMSGQMQDLIPVDSNAYPVCNAILYSDGRAEIQASEIKRIIGKDTIEISTANHFDGSMPFAKLLWLKQNMPALYDSAAKVLISSKDYVIARLTGAFVTDVTSASTTGLMAIHLKKWNQRWMEKVGLEPDKLPDIRYAQERAGLITQNAAEESGFDPGTPVYVGTGDAGATTLAGGIFSDGEFNINLGTSGWIASVADTVLCKPEVFNLAAMQQGLYINVVPFLNAGNVHRWISGVLVSDSHEDQYAYFDRLINKSRAGSNGVMFLPYLMGERFPVMDADIKGGYAGINPETTREDLARSALEGVAFSIRQGLDSIGKLPHKISLIGGGARVDAWCGILADVLNHPITIYSGSEYLPSAATAAAVLLEQGKISDYASFVSALLNKEKGICYEPDSDNVNTYQNVYRKYLKLYPALKTIR